MDKWRKLLVLAQRKDGTFVWSYSGREAEILDKNYVIVNLNETIKTSIWFLLRSHSLFWSILTVLCSSPSRTWNECSKIEYMILPMPKDGSITLGTISSTVGKKDGCFLTWTTNSRALGQVWCHLLPCKVFWNLFTLTMSLVSLNVLPAVSRLNSLQTETQQQHHQINSFIHRMDFSHHCRQKLPIFVKKLLLIADVAFVTGRQELQKQLGVFLVGRSYGSFTGLKLDNVNNFVRRR